MTAHSCTEYSSGGDEEKKEDFFGDTEALVTTFDEHYSIASFAPKMIVFDKDGTLGSDRDSLCRWVDEMSLRARKELESNNGTTANDDCVEECIAHIHLSIGLDPIKESLLPSALLAAGTWDEILAEFAQGLVVAAKEHGINIEELEAINKVSKWHKEIGSLHSQDEPVIGDLPRLVMECKEYGLKVAVCTSDDRESTNLALSRWGVDTIIDYSICGDEVTNGKPNADPLNILCRKAGVLEEECIVVGDTTADTGMAKSAGAGLMVGVLSGSGERDQLLSSGANLVLLDVGRIPYVLVDVLGMKKRTSKQCGQDGSNDELSSSNDFINDWILIAEQPETVEPVAA